MEHFNPSRPTLQPPTWQPKFEVHHDASRHVFSRTSLRKEPQCALGFSPSTWSGGLTELVNHIGTVFALRDTTCMHVETQCEGFFATRASFIWGHSRTSFVTARTSHTTYALCPQRLHKAGGVKTKTDDQQLSKSTSLQKRDPNPTDQGTCWTHHHHHQWSCHLDHNFWDTLYRLGWDPKYRICHRWPFASLVQLGYLGLGAKEIVRCNLCNCISIKLIAGAILYQVNFGFFVCGDCRAVGKGSLLHRPCNLKSGPWAQFYLYIIYIYICNYMHTHTQRHISRCRHWLSLHR